MVCRDYRHPDIKTLFSTKDVSITTHGSVRDTQKLRDIARIVLCVLGTQDPEDTRPIKSEGSNEKCQN